MNRETLAAIAASTSTAPAVGHGLRDEIVGVGADAGEPKGGPEEIWQHLDDATAEPFPIARQWMHVDLASSLIALSV
jgi:hypothetical protein